MKHRIFLALIVAIAFFGNGCRKIEVDGGTTTVIDTTSNPTQENLILSGKLNADRVLHASNVYTLRGLVYVTDGATITIEPGTKIVGEKNTRGALIVTRGCKLIAAG